MARLPVFGPSLPPAMAKARRKARKAAKAANVKPNVVEVKQIIKNVMSQELETKFRSQAPVINVAYNSAITNADIISLLPRMVQTQPNDPGNSYERMGQKITPRKLNIKAMVNLTSSLARSTNIVVLYYVLTHKSLKHFPDLNANQNVATKLFKTGDLNETFGFDGIYLNSTFPINDSEYVCHKRGKFLLGKNTGLIQDDSTGGNQPVYGDRTCHFLDFDVKCPAKLVYDPDSNSPRTVYYPNNFAPFIVFGYYHQDQSVADELNQDISITLRQSLYYDDA